MQPAEKEIKANWTDLNISGWASSRTSLLSPRPPGGSPAIEAAQGKLQGECQNFLSPEFETKSQRELGKYIFLEIPKFPYHTVQDRSTEASTLP